MSKKTKSIKDTDKDKAWNKKSRPTGDDSHEQNYFDCL